jgi:eukaryotic-like serine/threonine-protein kinase
MPEIGSIIGRFRLERSLGQGAMGTVYLAVDPEIERRVAIKIVRADGSGYEGRREEMESRFLKEAKIAGRLQHPNIVTIYDVGRDGDIYFIAMEYVEGRPLSRLLRPEVALADSQRTAILRQTAEALAHAHERGVIHRDVKPANILIRTDGVVKVSDFGIGKLLTGGGSDLTQTGQMIGSPSYMSPEQIKGEKLDGRADLFALGVVMYEMFTGQRPFPGDSITTLVYQILHQEPRDPVTIRADLPPVAREILKRALAKNREDRYPDAPAFLADLDRLATQSVSPDSQTTRIEPFVTLPAEPPRPPSAVLPGPGSGSHPGAATSGVASSMPTVIVEKRGGAALLFGIAALLLAAAALLFVVFQSRNARLTPEERRAEAPLAATSSVVTGTPVPLPSTVVPPPAGTVVTTEVGTPKTNATAPPVAPPPERPKPVKPAPAPPPVVAESAPAEAPAHEATAPRESADEGVFDNTYRTSRGMKFQISPDQARIYVDGRYVGIADDWDDHGGGKVFPFSPGKHRVQATLPGFHDLNLEVLVSGSAKDNESAGDELKKSGKSSYPKIPKLDAATTGSVVFEGKAGDADVTVDGKSEGPASKFTADHPLRLSGPAVHEVSVAGHKTYRVLVASTAGKDLAEIKVK